MLILHSHIAVANQRILNENQRILTELVRSWRVKTSSTLSPISSLGGYVLI